MVFTMHKGLKEPHVLLASSNPEKLIRNLIGILEQSALDKIRAEIDLNVKLLFQLGETHFRFATSINKSEWRQRISRLYYASYNVRRALILKYNGSYSTDIEDHKKIDDLPDEMNNASTYKSKLKNMREDRNLADYSHTADVADLLIPIDESEDLVREFIKDSKDYLNKYGVAL